MDFVIDCSIVASFLLPDEQHPIALKALESLRNKKAIVPAVFYWEIGNVLNVVQKSGRIDTDTLKKIIQYLHALPIDIDSIPDIFELNELIALATIHGLSVYDAAYLRLAKKFSIALLTLDDALLKAAKKERIPLYID
jgi:predicted nucleic acid-binding protein